MPGIRPDPYDIYEYSQELVKRFPNNRWYKIFEQTAKRLVDADAELSLYRRREDRCWCQESPRISLKPPIVVDLRRSLSEK